ncbi:unnamed protein product, partial [Ceratitis capitata]
QRQYERCKQNNPVEFLTAAVILHFLCPSAPTTPAKRTDPNKLSSHGWLVPNHRMRHSFNSAAATQLPRCELLSGNPTFPIRRNVRLAMHGVAPIVAITVLLARLLPPCHITSHCIASPSTKRRQNARIVCKRF